MRLELASKQRGRRVSLHDWRDLTEADAKRGCAAEYVAKLCEVVYWWAGDPEMEECGCEAARDRDQCFLSPHRWA